MVKTFQLHDGTWICQGLGYLGMSLNRERAIEMWKKAASAC